MNDPSGNTSTGDGGESTTVVRGARAQGDHSPFRDFVPYEGDPDEAYMNSNQIKHFRNMLLGWRHELMEQVDRTVNHLQDEASNFPDELDRATREEELGIELRTRDRGKDV